MLRSISEPSLGTVGTGTITTNATSRLSHINVNYAKSSKKALKGEFLWEGRWRKYTLAVMQTPWNMRFQCLVLLTILYQFISHLFLAYYLHGTWIILEVSIACTELLFVCDVIVHILHMAWPMVRWNMRVYRRNLLLLAYDVLSLAPLSLIVHHREDLSRVALVGRWLCIGRIYRLYDFFKQINEKIGTSRLALYMLEHFITVMLVLHTSTCLWYGLHRQVDDKWTRLRFPPHLSSRKLRFDNYVSCWYYCACRIFNTIFGDAFPFRDTDKPFTTLLMLGGFVFMRYQFTGTLTWELVLQRWRRSTFVDRYHQMISYLKLRGAPAWLVEQAAQYKQHLWDMKHGVLHSDHLQRLPLPLRMELIFDINVTELHNTLLFRNAGESILRSISLLMRHEIFLPDQHIWIQGVVKCGMICVKKGVVELLSDEDDESPMIAFKEGTVLGEISLFHSIPSKVTVKAATYVELQVLNRKDFLRAISEHPFMLEQIRENIRRRLSSTRQKQEAITRYDEGDSRLIRTRYRPMKVLKDNLAGVEEEDPTFVDDSHMYYKDANNVRQAKFTREYLELYNMSSNVTTVEVPRICLRQSFPWILEPNTGFTQMFDVIHFLLVIYVCMVSPHYVLLNRYSDLESVFNVLVTAGLSLNLYLQLTTAIVDKNTTKATVKEIAEVKMTSVGFYLDILSVFPVYIFTDTFDPGDELICGQVVKLFPVLQVWHIWDYIDKWKLHFDSNVKLLCLFKYTILTIIFSYWSGSLLYLLSCPRNLCLENSWVALLIHWETKVFITNEAKHENPILTVAFGTSVFTGSGTSDLSPGPADLIVVVVIFAAGMYLNCFYVAKMCSLFLLETQTKLKFKTSMRELVYFLSVNHVSGKIKDRVKKFFCVQWYYNNAISSKEIFEEISPNIKQEVLSMEMVETLLRCPIFKDCDRDFVLTVAVKCGTIVLPDNEIVQHAGDIGRDMYIVQQGHCNFLDHNGKVAKSIGPGNDFGVMEMLFGLPKVYTVLTSTNCILLHLEYSALVQSWGIFPDASDAILTVLEDDDLRNMAKSYEDAKPQTSRMDAKTNRIAQELKESFVPLIGYDKTTYSEAFEKLGSLKYIRYLFFPGSITPHGMFLRFWCIVRLLLAAYYITVIPYNFATKQHKYSISYTWTDIILYVDIIIMAYVAYYNEKSLLVTHPLLTVSHYLKGSFILDCISVFPLEYMMLIINDNTNMDLYRANRILLANRITGAFSYWDSNIMNVSHIMVLLKFLPVAVTLVNVTTAVIFSDSCLPYLPQGSNYLLVNCTRALAVTKSGTDTKYAAFEYARTFYWVFAVFIGCGCTPIDSSSSVDMWLNMLLKIVGFLYFAYMFGYVASSRSTQAHALLEHKEKTKDLANFLYQQNVDPILTANTLKYFEYVWKRTNGSNPQKICRRLNSALMEDTLVFMYEKALREVPLFGKVERSFIRVITQHLREMYFLKGEMVIQCKDVQPYIFIIYRGKVDVLSSYNEMVTCMGPGGMFGNFAGQPISCSKVSIYASRSLDLLVISSQTFFNLIKYYPKIQEPLHKAFQVSKDYILPITVNTADDTSTEDSEVDLLSMESALDSRSGSSRFKPIGQLSLSGSSSDLSQAHSSISGMTYHSYLSAFNLFRPGSWLFQGFGYLSCLFVTANYALCLYEITTLNDCFIFFWIQAAFDIFFYVKICLTMHQGYINKHGDLVLDASKCRIRYFKHKLWVWSDILVNFPLELFGFCCRHKLTAMHYLRINKLFRLKYLVQFYIKTSSELTNDLTTLQVVMTVTVVIILIHTFTCIWLLTLMAIAPTKIIRTLKMHLVDDISPQHNWDYVTSLYVVVAELTNTGGDEYIIDDIVSMSITSICLICGKMLAATVVATSIQVSYSTKYALNSYEKATGELIDMLKSQGLSSYQLKKFWQYVRNLWVTERGRQLPELLKQTPYVRRCDLMSALFGNHLRNCFLFAETGESFLRQLAATLDYAVFFPGNYILVAGDCDTRMYWVASGVVAVVSVRPDLTEITHETLEPGDVFGILQGLNRGVVHCFSYRAETKATILTLSSESWINILEFFPEAKASIAAKAEVLFSQI